MYGTSGEFIVSSNYRKDIQSDVIKLFLNTTCFREFNRKQIRCYHPSILK